MAKNYTKIRMVFRSRKFILIILLMINLIYYLREKHSFFFRDFVTTLQLERTKFIALPSAA